MKRLTLRAGTIAAVCLLGCKDATGPGVDFITLPSAVLTSLCTRGERVVGQAITGDVTLTDCTFLDGSHFDTFRVRVAAGGTYRFAVTSTFDSYLVLSRLDSFTVTHASLTKIAEDDDSGPGFDALITGVALSPGTDYFLFVNGFDATTVGTYSVAFTKP